MCGDSHIHFFFSASEKKKKEARPLGSLYPIREERKQLVIMNVTMLFDGERQQCEKAGTPRKWCCCSKGETLCQDPRQISQGNNAFRLK
jgi:hypothetical protein